MGRPRKNPDDPKWQEPINTPPLKLLERKDHWEMFFSAALSGLIARGGGQTYDQMIKTASEIADESQRFLYKKLPS